MSKIRVKPLQWFQSELMNRYEARPYNFGIRYLVDPITISGTGEVWRWARDDRSFSSPFQTLEAAKAAAQADYEAGILSAIEVSE